jgi:NIMA (never in mitosis gene a)-related kinase
MFMLSNKVKVGSLTAKEQQNALNEVRILASVHHENVISFKEAFIDDEKEHL